MDKKNIMQNIKALCESDFYYEMYSKTPNREIREEKEAESAFIFNCILLAAQLVEEKEDVKELATYMVENISCNNMGVINEYYVINDVFEKIKEKEPNFTKEIMQDRLMHGVAVHFTTPKILEKIENDGKLSANNSIFTKEEEKKIINASFEQYSKMTHEEKLKGEGLSIGFGIGKGISMSTQTPSYWMNHTPESLSFIYGGNVYDRDKEGMLEHLFKSTKNVTNREEIIEILESKWDELIGEDKSLGCVLIDRDALEYEADYYYNTHVPKKVERRPFNRDIGSSVMSIEDERYTKDIDISSLSLIKVPSIDKLEQKEYDSNLQYIKKRS